MDEALVQVLDVTTRYGSRLVHDHISLEVPRGKITAVVGGSGSGKSTLMREMALLQAPTQGRVRVLGRDAYAISETESLALRRHIGVLFQQGALFSDLTVSENVATPLREHTQLTDSLIAELSALKLAFVGLSPDVGALLPNQLSGGMTKRAALARAIALDPELLFLDEPVSGLDPSGADALDELVLQLKASLGLTIVMVTHDMDSLWRVADRIVLLGEGRIIGIGSMSELSESDDPKIRSFFSGPRGRAAARHHKVWTKK